MSNEKVQQALQRMQAAAGFTTPPPPAENEPSDKDVSDALAHMRAAVGVPFTIDITNERNPR